MCGAHGHVELSCRFRNVFVFLSVLALGHVAFSEVTTLNSRNTFVHYVYPDVDVVLIDGSGQPDDGLNVTLSLRSSSKNGLVACVVSRDRTSFALVSLRDSYVVLTVGVGGQVSSATADTPTTFTGTSQMLRLVQDGHSLVTTVSVHVLAGSPANSLSNLAVNAPGLVAKSQADVFIGGIPTNVGDLPAALLGHPRLAACVEGVRLEADGQVGQAAEDTVGTTSSSCDACQSSSCLNGAACYAEALTSGCNCAESGKVGPTCAEDGIVATFAGGAHLAYTLDTIRSDYCQVAESTIYLQLKTLQADGTILEVANDLDSRTVLLVTLQNGMLRVAVDYTFGSSSTEFAISSSSVVNDDTWHRIAIGTGSELTLAIDGAPQSGDAAQLSACVGGNVTIGNRASLSPATGFVGCLRGLQINVFTPLDDLRERQPEAKRGILHYHHPKFGTTCEARLLQCPVGMAQNLSILLVDSASSASYTGVSLAAYGKLEFQFSTEDAEGLLLSAHGSQDYLFLQFEDDQLCVLARAGTGPGGKTCSSVAGGLSGRVQHRVVLSKRRDVISLIVDDAAAGQVTVSRDMLHLDHELVWGRLASPCSGSEGNRSALVNPPDLKAGYRGCLETLTMNGFCIGSIDDFTCSTKTTSSNAASTVAPPTEGELAVGTLFEGCHHDFCDIKLLCQNDGKCVAHQTSFSCDCAGTGFRGKFCEEEGPTATFFGGELIKRQLNDTALDSMFFIFRAWQQTNDTITLATVYDDSNQPNIVVQQQMDDIAVYFLSRPGTYIRLKLTVPDLSTSFEYHKVRLAVSITRQEVGPRTITIQSFRFEVAGPNFKEVRSDRFGGTLKMSRVEYGLPAPANPNAGTVKYASSVPFRGHLREPVVNEVQVGLELESHLKQKVIFRDPTSSMVDVSTETLFANITVGEWPFSNYTTYLATPAVAKTIPLLKPLSHLFFRFRTPVADDAVLFDARVVVLLLKRRRVVLLVRKAAESDEGQTRAHVREAKKLNDREWHDVTLEFDSDSFMVTVSVDGITQTVAYPSNVQLGVDTVAFGGALTTERYADLPVKQGFSGCLESPWVNNDYKDLYNARAVNLLSPDNVEMRCPACKPVSPCYNDGVCSENVDDSYTCDCRGTGFMGARCLQEATTATLYNDTSLTLAISDEEAVPRSLVFLYRSWKQAERVVNLATLRDSTGAPRIVIQQGNDDQVQILIKPAPASGAAEFTIPLSNASAFAYAKVAVRFPQPGDASDDMFSVSLGSSTPISVPMPETPLRLSSINFGIKGVSGDDTQSVPLEGHLRDVSYNHYSVMDGIVAGSSNISSNVTIGEEVFSNYTVHYLTADAHHNLRYDLPVGTVSFGMTPEDFNTDSLIIDIHGHEYGSIQLLTIGGKLQLRVTSDPEYQTTSKFAEQPTNNLKPGSDVGVVVSVLRSQGQALLIANGVSTTVDFPSGFDALELFALSVGGASSHRLQAIMNQTGTTSLLGYRGCVRHLSINGDSAELVPPSSSGAPSGDILDRCLACSVLNDTCRNGGLCLDNGDLKYTCDCFNTEFSGDKCTDRPLSVTVNNTHVVYDAPPATSSPSVGLDVGFLYRLWQQPTPTSTVLLATAYLRPDSSRAYQVLHDATGKVSLHLSGASPSLVGVVTLSLGDIENFNSNFMHLSLRLTQGGNNITLHAGSTVATFAVTESAEISRLVIGEATSLAGVPDSVNPIGHFKRVIVNQVPLLQPTSAANITAARGELPFDTYTVSFQKAGVRKTISLGAMPIGSLSFSARPRSTDGEFLVAEVLSGQVRMHILITASSVQLSGGDARQPFDTSQQESVSVPFDSTSSPWLMISLKVTRSGMELTVNGQTEQHAWKNPLDATKPYETANGNSVTIGGSASGARQSTGYLGCVEALFVNDEFQDLPRVPVSGLPADVEQQEQTSAVPGCPLCQFGSPCRHQGRCVDMPAGKVSCNCDGTSYHGMHCDKRATAATLFGNSTVKYVVAADNSMAQRFHMHFRRWDTSTEPAPLVNFMRSESGTPMIQIAVTRRLLVVRSVESDVPTELAEIDLANAAKFRYSSVVIDFSSGNVSLFDRRNSLVGRVTSSSLGAFPLEGIVIPSSEFQGHVRALLYNGVAILDEPGLDVGSTPLREISFDPFAVTMMPASFFSFTIEQSLHTSEFTMLLPTPSENSPGNNVQVLMFRSAVGYVAVNVINGAMQVVVAPTVISGDSGTAFEVDSAIGDVRDSEARTVHIHVNQHTRILRLTVTHGDTPIETTLDLSAVTLPEESSDEPRGFVALGKKEGENDATMCIQSVSINKEPQDLHEQVLTFGVLPGASAARSNSVVTYCQLCDVSTVQSHPVCFNGGKCFRNETGARHCRCNNDENFGQRCEKAYPRFSFLGTGEESIQYPSDGDSKSLQNVMFAFRAWEPLAATSIVSLYKRNGDPAVWLTSDVSGVWLHRSADSTPPPAPVLVHEYPRQKVPFDYIATTITAAPGGAVTVKVGDHEGVTVVVATPAVGRVVFGAPSKADVNPFHGHIRDLQVNGVRAGDDVESDFDIDVVPGEIPFGMYTTTFDDSLVQLPVKEITQDGVSASLSFLPDPEAGDSERTLLAVVSSTSVPILKIALKGSKVITYRGADATSNRHEQTDVTGAEFHSISLSISQHGAVDLTVDNSELLDSSGAGAAGNSPLGSLFILLGKDNQSDASAAYAGCMRSLVVNGNGVNVIASSGQQLGTKTTSPGCPTCRYNKLCQNEGTCSTSDLAACTCPPSHEGIHCQHAVSASTFFGNTTLKFNLSATAKELRLSYRIHAKNKLSHVLALHDAEGNVVFQLQESENCLRANSLTPTSSGAADWVSSDVFCDPEALAKFEYRHITLNVSPRQPTTLRMTIDGETLSVDRVLFDRAFPAYSRASVGNTPAEDAFPKDAQRGDDFIGHLKGLQIDRFQFPLLLGQQTGSLVGALAGELQFPSSPSVTGVSVAPTTGVNKKLAGPSTIWWIPIVIVVCIVLLVILIVIIYRRKKIRDEEREERKAKARGESEA